MAYNCAVKMRVARTYLVVIERAQDGTHSAYVPDLPGCVVIGQSSIEDVEQLIRQAVQMHIDGLLEDGLQIPEPTSQAEYVQI